VIFLELFCDLVFLVSIGWYFLGILPTDTKENLVGTFRYCKFGGNLFFTQKGGIGPLFEVPAKLFKKGFLAKSQLGK
jgi:hypothetical protein